MPRLDMVENTTTSARHFIFCTGIENSYPVVTDKHGKRVRRDGMAASNHYRRWKQDFDLVKDLGINFLRCGPPYYKCHLGPLRYDWDFADKTFARLLKLKIHPIVDLCHFGVPDWIGNFQNPEWPELFADYAAAFARRFQWVRCYTPVNEIFVAARFSAQLGWWNEQLKTDRGFVTALKHLARGNLLAEQAILKVQPNALFIQSESSEYFHANSPDAQPQADYLNEKRFLSLDLCYGNDVRGAMYEYLLDNGVSREEYHWFLDHGSAIRAHCVMGNDYYITNEHEVFGKKGDFRPSGEIFGYYVITKQYFDRYRLPVMHTETNRKIAADAPAWLWKEWSNVLRLKSDGVPILGFTWYSLLDQTDWDTALREVNHRVNPLGLYDLNRRIREVGTAYKEVIAQWHAHLPLQSMSRDLLLYPEDTQPIQPLPDNGGQRMRSSENLDVGSRANAQRAALGQQQSSNGEPDTKPHRSTRPHRSRARMARHQK